MLSGKIMAAAAGRSITPPVHTVSATSIDATGKQGLTKNTSLTGVVDGSTGIFSAWINPNWTTSGTSREILNLINGGSARLIIGFNSSNKVRFYATSAYETLSTTTYTSTSGWLHILMSWNTNAASGAKTFQLYVNGESITRTTTDTGGALSIDYDSPEIGIAKRVSSAGAIPGCLSEIYFAPNQYLDFSIAANREKFVVAGEPADLGSNGSTPTGTAPAIYLKNPAASFNTNSGTGGNFTIAGGPLTDCASTPSYFVAKAAAFNGTNQDLYVSSGLGGSTSSSKGTLSFWVKPNTLSSNINIMGSVTPGIGSIRIASDGGGWVQLRGPASENFVINFVAGSFVAGVWNHVLCSWNTSGGAGSKITYLYVNNVNKKGTVNDTSAGFSMNWNNGSSVAICSTLSSNYLNGSLAEFFLHVGTAANFSNASERNKFSVSGKPVYLGETGELPFGSAPMIYLKDPFTTYNNNSGTGVDFTLRNGPLADGGTVSY